MAQPAVRSTRRSLTPEQRDARALALAEAHSLTGTAHLEAAGEIADIWRVPSADRRGVHYVRHFHHSDELRCDCLAAAYGRSCGHVGAVLHAERQRDQAQRETGPSQAWAWWMAGGEWLD